MYAWPSTTAFIPETMDWGPLDNDRAFESPFNGAVQTASLPGTRWTVALNFPWHKPAERPALEAFLAKCRREHRIAMWHLKRPLPRGTCNLTGVTLGAALAQFATQATLAGCGAGKTLLAGDMLGLPGNVLLMVAEDATANGSGVMVVKFTHMVRTAQALGAAVTLNKPTAVFMIKGPLAAFPAAGVNYSPLTVELMEVFQ